MTFEDRLTKMEHEKAKEAKDKETRQYISAIGYAILTAWILWMIFTL